MTNLLRLQLAPEGTPQAEEFHVYLLWRDGRWTGLNLGAHESEQRARWMALDLVVALHPPDREQLLTFIVERTKSVPQETEVSSGEDSASR